MATTNAKEQIIAAATKEFLVRGYSGARMQNIADKAKINKALLHYYFENKEKLYYVVLKAQFADLIKGVLKIFGSEEDFEPWLKHLIRTLLREISARPHFTRFMIWELNDRDKYLPRLFAELMQERMQGGFMQKIQEKLDLATQEEYPAAYFLLNVLSLCIYPGIARPLLEQMLGAELFNGQDFLAQREEDIFQMIKHGIIERTRGDK